MITRCTACVLLAAGLWLAAMPVPAAPEEGEVVVHILVNYGSAYKDQTWAPVDVVITNNLRDITGTVEVRTYAGDEVQSPIYRQPVELPKSSQKRFQFHCFFNQTTRLTVQIYDGRRRVFEVPQELPGLQPINEEDLLCLVLDEEATGFSFLPMALNLKGTNRGIHRETVGSGTLPYLSEHPQSYAPLDLLVMGNIDPQQIDERTRDIIREYVRKGGVLAVCTGSHSRNYRGSWVEELTGTAVGPETIVAENVLAQEAFPPEQQEGARPNWQCTVATLQPQADGVEPIGAQRILGTRRSFGSGTAYTLAVDADSKALQECLGYKTLWREICTARRGVGDLNFTAAADYAVEALPRVSGIVIHSKASVVMYLALYFLVAIVGNWVFFSWLKRREWAWAALVVFAIGFTAYAMIYGTTGRARTSELHQVQVVQVPLGGGISSVDSFVGILTAHTARYSLRIDHPAPLAEDLYYRMSWRQPSPSAFGSGFGSATRPFTFVQSTPPHVEDFRIGASELRLMRVLHDVELGGVEGTLTFDDKGLHGELINKTGLRIENSFLYFRGRRFDLAFTPGENFIVDIPAALLGPASLAPGNPGNYVGGFRPQDNRVPPSALRRHLGTVLFTSTPSGFAPGSFDPVYYEDQMLANARPRLDLGPYLCGWSTDKHFPIVSTSEPLRRNLDETLLVADVAIDYQKDPGSLHDFSRLRQWAVERTPDMDQMTAGELDELEAAVKAEVQANPSGEDVSDLIGSYSQLAQHLERYRRAEELALEWGVQGKELEEAAVWDRMLEKWVIGGLNYLPGGEQSMMQPLPYELDRFAHGDSIDLDLMSWGWTVCDEKLVQGFVHPDRLLQQTPQYRAMGGQGEMAQYSCCAVTELWSPDDRTVGFVHGSDDWTRVLVNGREVHRSLVGRDANPVQDRFSASLKSGRNVILVISGNNRGEWEFSLAPSPASEGLENRLPEGVGDGRIVQNQ